MLGILGIALYSRCREAAANQVRARGPGFLNRWIVFMGVGCAVEAAAEAAAH